MTGGRQERDIWYWYHNISECYYHIQLTVKYRKPFLDNEVQRIIKATLTGYKERYTIEISEVGFDNDHLHILCRFLPKYSGGQVVRLLKSTMTKEIFKFIPELKKELWRGEFWTDGYYIATISAHGTKSVIQNYIKNQGREKDIPQLRLFTLD
jgi:REP element-mobilizing transposase RayT